MAEVLKVLGQSSATAAQASDILNLVKDPSFEGMTVANANNYVTSSSTWLNIPNTLWKYYSTSGYSGSMYVGSSLYNSSWSTFKINTGLVSDASIGNQALIFGGNSSPNTYVTMYITYGLSTAANAGAQSSSYFGGTSNAIPVSPSTVYYYGASAARYQYSSYNFRVLWFDASGSYITDNSFNPTSSGSTFGRGSTSVTSPSNAAYAGIEIYVEYYLSNSRVQFAIDGVFFGPSSSLSSTTPDPNSTSGNLLVAPFTDRFNSTWTGDVNNSITVKNYAGAATDIYTVPASKAAVVSSIVVANPSISATSYRIAVVPSGETLALKHWNFFDIPLAAKSSQAITLGLTLRAGDKIKISSDSSNTQFSVYGSELDQA
jgi:hypothetical protein